MNDRYDVDIVAQSKSHINSVAHTKQEMNHQFFLFSSIAN